MVSRPALPAAPPVRPGWCRGALMEGARPPPGEAEGGGDAATAPTALSETQLGHVWPWFLCGPEELHFASGTLLHQQLEEEMREVQNYVDHVRALTEARDALAVEYERENEELRTKFAQLQLEQESQHKEVAELLALEGLATIVHSSPSEQVAYLLVERSSLLERMEVLEQELGAPHCLGRPCADSLQAQDERHLFHPRLEEGLHQPQPSLHHLPGTLPLAGEPDGGRPVWEEAGRGLEGAPDRLRSAQEGVPALEEDLDAAEGERGNLRDSAGAEIWRGTLGEEAERPQPPLEPLAKPSHPGGPLSDLEPDSHGASGPREASEQNPGTDRLLLHGRLCSPEQSDLGGFFKHELHSYRSELLRLYGELRVLQGAAEERESLHLTHQKLLHQNGRLKAKVLELSRECERLNQPVLRERKEEEEEEEEEGVVASRLSCPEFPAGGPAGEDQVPNQGGDGEPSRCSSRASKMGELEKPGRAQQEEEEEAASFLKEILAVQRQLSAHRERPGARPRLPRAALGSPAGDTEQGAPHRKGAPQEGPPGLLWGPRQTPSSGKKQLRLEQEGSLALRLQNLQLQQENLQAQAELRQTQAKVLEACRACGVLASQGELSRQQVMKELLQNSQDAQQQSRLREQLAQESHRAAQAEKRVEELEQGLQESRRLWESQAALGRRQLEEEAREARAREAEARRSLQEEQKRRRLLEQEKEEEQQKEAQLLQASADRQAQQQEGQLRALEEERGALAQEQLHSQSLSEELCALQREKEALCEEQRRMLKQLDLALRKQSEQQLRHRARLRQAKERLQEEVKLREARIRHLEDEVRLSKSQAEKDQLLIRQVTGENESLFREQRKSLEQLHSLEEAKQSNGRALRILQSRVRLLERENLQLQDWVLQLGQQVGILERALRTIHAHSLEELKTLGFPQYPLQGGLLPFPQGFSFSVTSGLCQALREGPPVEAGPKALLSPLAFQGSRVGCLNLAIPGKPPGDFRQDQPSHPVG